MIDVQEYVARMDSLKQVPVSVARVLCKNGGDVIYQATLLAIAKNLPGMSARKTATGKLRWHEGELSKLSDPNAIYSSGDDLKKWVLAAYVEANAVEEGLGWVSTAWGKMWNEIGAAIAKLPVQIAMQINETAGALLGVPGWAVGVAVLSIVGVGVAAYTGVLDYGRSKILGGKR